MMLRAETVTNDISIRRSRHIVVHDGGTASGFVSTMTGPELFHCGWRARAADHDCPRGIGTTIVTGFLEFLLGGGQVTSATPNTMRQTDRTADALHCFPPLMVVMANSVHRNDTSLTNQRLS
jgi:hypothetical protein